MIQVPDIRAGIERGEKEIGIRVDDKEMIALLEISDRQRQSLLAGGRLAVTSDIIPECPISRWRIA